LRQGLCCLSARPVNWKCAIDLAAPPPLSTASRPCAPPVAGRRSSRPRCRRRGIPLRRQQCGRRFQGRRRPPLFR